MASFTIDFPVRETGANLHPRRKRSEETKNFIRARKEG